jgi:hypothetical protein
MTNITVNYKDNYTSESSDEMYGEWYDGHDIVVKNVKVAPDKGYSESTMWPGQDEGISPGMDLFLVEVTYSHGDSFGISRGNKDWPFAFKDIETATRVVQAIKENGDKEYQIKVDGVPISCSAWQCYFGGLDDVEVIKTYVGVSV